MSGYVAPRDTGTPDRRGGFSLWLCIHNRRWHWKPKYQCFTRMRELHWLCFRVALDTWTGGGR